ncbi:MAG: hypothetical protein FWH41_08785 [Treponema sp.]|nr:hypothetical protein [Treponema sp.]
MKKGTKIFGIIAILALIFTVLVSCEKKEEAKEEEVTGLEGYQDLLDAVGDYSYDDALDAANQALDAANQALGTLGDYSLDDAMGTANQALDAANQALGAIDDFSTEDAQKALDAANDALKMLDGLNF